MDGLDPPGPGSVLALHHDDVQVPEDDFGQRLLQAWVEVLAKPDGLASQGAKQQPRHEDEEGGVASPNGEEESENEGDEEGGRRSGVASTGPAVERGAARPPRHDVSQSARPQQPKQYRQDVRRHSETDPPLQGADASPARELRGSGSGNGVRSLLSKLVGPALAARASSRSTPATARKSTRTSHAALAPPGGSPALAAAAGWDPHSGTAFTGEGMGLSSPRTTRDPRTTRWTHPYDGSQLPDPHTQDPDWAPNSPWRQHPLPPHLGNLSSLLCSSPDTQQADEDAARLAAQAQHAYALGLSHYGAGEPLGVRTGKARRFGSNSSSELNAEQLYAHNSDGAWYAAGVALEPGASPRWDQGGDAAWPLAQLVPGTPAQLGHVRIHQQAALGTAVLNLCSTADALRVSAAATSAAVAAVGGRVAGLSGLVSSRAGAAAGGGAAAASVIGASRAAAAAESKPATTSALAALVAASKGRGPLASAAAPQQHRRSPQQQQQQQQQLRNLQQQQQQQQQQLQRPSTPTDFWQRQLVASVMMSRRRRHSSGLEAAAAAAAVSAQDAGGCCTKPTPGIRGPSRPALSNPQQQQQSHHADNQHDQESGSLRDQHQHQHQPQHQPQPQPQHQPQHQQQPQQQHQPQQQPQHQYQARYHDQNFYETRVHPQQQQQQQEQQQARDASPSPQHPSARAPSSPSTPPAPVLATYPRSFQLQAPAMQQQVTVLSARHEGYSKAALLFGHRRDVTRFPHAQHQRN